MKKLWIVFAGVLFTSFSVLGWIGTRIHEEMPPLVNKVVTTEGTVVIDADEISAGQNVWQTLGGMEVGSVSDEHEGSSRRSVDFDVAYSARTSRLTRTGSTKAPHVCID